MTTGDDEGARDLQDESNDLLLMLIESNATQEAYLRKIHYWVKFMGVVLLVGLLGTLGAYLAAQGAS